MLPRFSKIWFLITCVLGLGLALCFTCLKILPTARLAILNAQEPSNATHQTEKPSTVGAIAHISIPDTSIDEEVFYTKDDFYIDHDRWGNKDFKGEIFMQALNTTDFTDPVTLIYGHNFHKNDDMFSELWKYRDRAYFDSHPYIYIDHGNKTLAYEVISAYVYDSRNILASFDFSDVSMQTAYYSYVLNPDDSDANVKETTLVAGKDKLLQLSTCVNMQDTKSNRFLVTAKLLGMTEQGQ